MNYILFSQVCPLVYVLVIAVTGGSKIALVLLTSTCTYISMYAEARGICGHAPQE